MLQEVQKDAVTNGDVGAVAAAATTGGEAAAAHAVAAEGEKPSSKKQKKRAKAAEKGASQPMGTQVKQDAVAMAAPSAGVVVNGDAGKKEKEPQQQVVEPASAAVTEVNPAPDTGDIAPTSDKKKKNKKKGGNEKVVAMTVPVTTALAATTASAVEVDDTSAKKDKKGELAAVETDKAEPSAKKGKKGKRTVDGDKQEEHEVKQTEPVPAMVVVDAQETSSAKKGKKDKKRKSQPVDVAPEAEQATKAEETAQQQAASGYEDSLEPGAAEPVRPCGYGNVLHFPLITLRSMCTTVWEVIMVMFKSLLEMSVIRSKFSQSNNSF